jgi:predicted lipoprotein with Yx(FWY)xxD motif
MKIIHSGTMLPMSFLIIVAAIVSCTKSSDMTSSGTGAAVSVANDVNLGHYLVDKNGQTLYFFANDYNGRNSCPGGCAAIWPYFDAGTLTQANLGQGLNLADFDTIMVDGTVQTRYKGWPLYYYAPDGYNLEPRGKITGESIPNWFVAKPDYTIMLADGQLVGKDGKDYLDTHVEGAGKTLYFTDAYGLTLYTFSPDSFDVNKFTRPDFSNNAIWPIYDTTKVVVPSVLDKSQFAVIDVYGKKQLTYKGWPLYYFGPDNKIRGNTMGVSVPAPGVWPVPEEAMPTAPKRPI